MEKKKKQTKKTKKVEVEENSHKEILCNRWIKCEWNVSNWNCTKAWTEQTRMRAFESDFCMWVYECARMCTLSLIQYCQSEWTFWYSILATNIKELHFHPILCIKFHFVLFTSHKRKLDFNFLLFICVCFHSNVSCFSNLRASAFIWCHNIIRDFTKLACSIIYRYMCVYVCYCAHLFLMEN